MKLDFVIPGFSKCGTTTLCSLLDEHPDICISKIKEPNFFSLRYNMGWPWYERQFSSASPHQLCGDGSTVYSTDAYAEESCKRILQYFPETRFIFIARNPVTRLESSFREFHHNGYKFGVETPDSIRQALKSLPNMIADTRFWSIINIYRDRVPDHRIHVLFLEDFKRNPGEELKKCFAFLGVDEKVPIQNLNRQLNTASTKYRDTKLMRFIHRHRWTNRLWTKMDHVKQDEWGRRLGLRKRITQSIAWPLETRQWLYEILKDEVQNFLKFYGKPVDFWDFEAWAGMSQATDRAVA